MRIKRRHRAVFRSGLATGLLVIGVGPLRAQDGSVAGRYDFEALSVEGTPFAGSVLVGDEPGGGHSGVLISTLRPPVPLVAAGRDGDRVRLTFDVGGPRPVFELNLRDGEFDGRWLFAEREGPIHGSYALGPRVDLEPRACVLAGVEGPAECAVLHVPEDRENPGGRWIPINIAILPAVAAERSGALFHFAGGPGQAASAQASGNAMRFGEIRSNRDVVMIDQRGTGGSNPLNCDWGGASETVRAILAWELPPRKVSECARQLRSRADLRLYATRHAAEDVEAVRRWLGYGRIDLYGGSYGSRAALEYARRYPAAVRTVTLRGVMPPGASMSVENPRRVDAELERVFEQCEADARCAGAYPTLRSDYAALRAELAESPARLTVADPRSGDSVHVRLDEAALAGSLRRLLMSEDGRSFVPLAIVSAGAGDWSSLAPGVVGTLAISGSMYFGMALSVSCAEEVPFTRSHDWVAETEGTLMGPRPAKALIDACAEWDRLPPDPTAFEPVRLAAPTLLVSGAYDPATPAAWGEHAAASAVNGLHVVLSGGSHTPFPACGLRIMATFVEAGTIEGLDTACATDREAPPFVLPAAGSLE